MRKTKELGNFNGKKFMHELLIALNKKGKQSVVKARDKSIHSFQTEKEEAHIKKPMPSNLIQLTITKLTG